MGEGNVSTELCLSTGGSALGGGLHGEGSQPAVGTHLTGIHSFSFIFLALSYNYVIAFSVNPSAEFHYHLGKTSHSDQLHVLPPFSCISDKNTFSMLRIDSSFS